MPILNYETLTPNLEPLDKVKIDLTGVNMLELKSNFNEDEVREHFVPFIAERLLAYQVLRFLDFIPEFDSKLFTTNSELIENHTSQINKDAGLPEKIDFYKFTASLKDTLKNEFKSINNGEESISVDWMLSCCFLDLTHLPKVLLVNQEDLPFKEEEGSYYGRSILALCIQEYYAQHKDIMLKNFNILQPANDPTLAAAAEDHLKKQRDIALRREEAREHLSKLKCQKTGRTGLDILSEGFTVLK